MRKLAAMFLSIALLISVLSFACASSPVEREIILLTEYRQTGWGEKFQLGALDSSGNLWVFESETRGDIPYEQEKLLSWAESTADLTLQGTLEKDKLADVASLVRTVQAQTASCQNCGCDAGEQTSLAIRRDRSGNREIIVLGISGDDTFENSDPSAQSLYKTLRRLFPAVVSYDGEGIMAPTGFQETDLLTFCGYEGIDLTKLTIKAFANDCEAGASEIEPQLSAAEIMNMKVTGKQNSLSTTGNTVTYFFCDADGNTVAVFEFYGKLLVSSDGMYTIGD